MRRTVKIKLCGLTRLCDAEYANRLLPEYVGFVFAENSRRRVSPERAEELKRALDASITAVGVFANQDAGFIAELVERGIIDAVQLHGAEDGDYAAALKERVRCPVIKAFRVESAADIETANRFPADLVLLDSGGGTGRTFDHSLIGGITRRYFLAGGLTPENVAAAVSGLHPYAVDASSSLETDGLKDMNKMTAFVNAVRQAKTIDNV